MTGDGAHAADRGGRSLPRAELPRVLGGSPTEDELAALAAVLGLLALERAAVVERLDPERVRSAWDRSARALREPDLGGRRWETTTRG